MNGLGLTCELEPGLTCEWEPGLTWEWEIVWMEASVTCKCYDGRL